MYKCVKDLWEVAEMTKTQNQLHLLNVIIIVIIEVQ